ncbi:MAG: S-layer homology domain-containing protein, partial [Acidimicrobiia bacterium]
MPKQVLTRRRSWTARIVVLAVVFSLVAVALPASAHSIPIDTTVSCPSTTPSAGFTDISAFGTDVQLAINCLAAFDITLGTTATTYSPNDVVARWQMALFLVRQARAHGITVPAPLPQGYTDIALYPQATQDAINQVTQLGISKGTSTTTFSPGNTVTRWQMALFLRRLAGAAGVTVTDDPVHNQFSDIGAFSAEIQAAINFLADGHIALGTGTSLFSPNEAVFRWSMALFLTRVLAADGIAQPQVLVTVTPTDAVTLATGNARSYTATFKNADGTPYTGAVGLALFQVTGTPGVVQYDFVPPPTATFESVSDGLVVTGTTAEGFPGLDGIVTFVVRDIADVTETIVPVAYEDLNNDNDPEISGNSAPAEPFG